MKGERTNYFNPLLYARCAGKTIYGWKKNKKAWEKTWEMKTMRLFREMGVWKISPSSWRSKVKKWRSWAWTLKWSKTGYVKTPRSPSKWVLEKLPRFWTPSSTLISVYCKAEWKSRRGWNSTPPPERWEFSEDLDQRLWEIPLKPGTKPLRILGNGNWWRRRKKDRGRSAGRLDGKAAVLGSIPLLPGATDATTCTWPRHVWLHAP